MSQHCSNCISQHFESLVPPIAVGSVVSWNRSFARYDLTTFKRGNGTSASGAANGTSRLDHGYRSETLYGTCAGPAASCTGMEQCLRIRRIGIESTVSSLMFSKTCLPLSKATSPTSWQTSCYHDTYRGAAHGRHISPWAALSIALGASRPFDSDCINFDTVAQSRTTKKQTHRNGEPVASVVLLSKVETVVKHKNPTTV